MSKTTPHNTIQVRCTMDQPIELLIDKLSTKSTDLYIFWQNYNQMYRQYNQKITENIGLKQEIEQLRRLSVQYQQPQTQVQEVRVPEDPYLKDRLKGAEATVQGLRGQIQKQKNSSRDLKIQNSRLTQQITQMQILISQLREQNSQQRISIANILQKLKTAQSELTNYQKLYEQYQEKDALIARLVQKQKQLNVALQEKEEEIEKMGREFKEARNKYERIIKETVQNAKQSVMESLPPNYKHIGEKIRANHQF